MDAGSKDGMLAVLGLLGVVYGAGMALSTWRGPKSRYYEIFKPRWRGVRASLLAAFVQAPLYLSLGGFFLAGAFHHLRSAQVLSSLFVVFALLSVGIFFVDGVIEDGDS